MSTAGLFLHITGRATASGILIALMTQALFGALFAGFGVAAVAGGHGSGDAAPALLGILFLGFVGAIAGGLLGIPTGLFVGVTGGLLMSTITRLFFHPPTNRRIYPPLVATIMALYTVGASWLSLMAVYLLFSRDHAVHSPIVPWLALLQATIAGALGYFLAGGIARAYLRAASRPAAPTPEEPAALAAP